MTIAIAVSTMNENIIGLENNYKNLDQNININVCHQNTNSLIDNTQLNEIKNKYRFNIFPMNIKGLSKSRNCLLSNSKEDILIISDDDVTYVNNLKEVIKNSYNKYPEADIITFQIKTPDGNYYKNYEEKPFWHTKRTILKVSSVEITVKRKSIINKELQFDENFGLGSTFPTGEEAIFLNDSLNKGLKILYVPIHISTHPIESSGKQFNKNISLIEAKGALLFRLYKKLGYIASILFAIKKYKLSDQNLLNFIKIMFNGIQKYRFLKKEKNAKYK